MFHALHDATVGARRVMAELVQTFMLKGLRHAAQHPIGPQAVRLTQQPLPPPMIPGNWPADKHTCALGDLFKASVSQADEVRAGSWHTRWTAG
jgi:hypothetical protein